MGSSSNFLVASMQDHGPSAMIGAEPDPRPVAGRRGLWHIGGSVIESSAMSSFEIVEPRSVEEAFGFLAGDDPAIRPFAGGTALMLMMKAQVFRPVRLVSLRALDGRFAGIAPAERGTQVRIGAMTTFSTLERSANIRRC